MGRLNRSSASEKYELIRLVEESKLPVKRTLAEIGLPRSTLSTGPGAEEVNVRTRNIVPMGFRESM